MESSAHREGPAARHAAPARHLPAAQSLHHRRAVLRLLRHRAGDERPLRGRGGRDLRRDGARRPGRAGRAADAHPERVRRRVRQPRRRGRFRRGAGAGDVRMGAQAARAARLDRRVRLLRRRPRFGSRASTSTSTSSTSATSRACRARRPPRCSPGSSGSSTTSISSAPTGCTALACGLTFFAAITMVTSVPFYSFKDINFRRSVPFWAVLVIVARADPRFREPAAGAVRAVRRLLPVRVRDVAVEAPAGPRRPDLKARGALQGTPGCRYSPCIMPRQAQPLTLLLLRSLLLGLLLRLAR